MTGDPYAEAAPVQGIRFLGALNPLAKFCAPLPAMIALVFVRDLHTPLAFLAIAYALVLVGARLTARIAVTLFLGIPAAIAAIGLGFSLWTDAARVAASEPLLDVGDWTLYTGALETGFATALRLGAIVTLALIGGLTTTGPDLVRSLVQQLRVPYRVGYTALAAFRFVPRFAHELEVIRQAHRVRGAHGGRGPLAAIARWAGYVVPLLAGAIRHAERVALAMDARAFGAHPTRTERHIVAFRLRDGVFVFAFWAVTAGVLIAFPARF